MSDSSTLTKGKAAAEQPDSSSSASAASSASDVSTKSLASQVMQLAALVKQNTRLLIQHGEDIMRIDAARMGISSTNGEPLVTQDSAAGASEEMLSELVAELQIKLDELEERSIRRTANSFARDAEDVIEWMPLPDPEAAELPSTTLGAFEAIETKELLNAMKVYGLAHYEEGMPLPNQAEFVALYNECARFLGLRSRKK